MGKVKRMYALTNTASGAAGEIRVASELARCAIKVAKPYWNDDEIDLLVLWRKANQLVPIPVQVKSIQRLDETKGENANDFISGLKKRYVEGLPALCLAIYNPATDRIWFIDTAENIKQLYKDQKASFKNHIAYDELADDADVRIGFNLSQKPTRLDANWLVPNDDASWFSSRIANAAKLLLDNEVLKEMMQRMFFVQENDKESEA